MKLLEVDCGHDFRVLAGRRPDLLLTPGNSRVSVFTAPLPVIVDGQPVPLRIVIFNRMGLRPIHFMEGDN